jgi:hypothetical protein
LYNKYYKKKRKSARKLEEKKEKGMWIREEQDTDGQQSYLLAERDQESRGEGEKIHE